MANIMKPPDSKRTSLGYPVLYCTESRTKIGSRKSEIEANRLLNFRKYENIKCALLCAALCVVRTSGDS